MLEAYSSAIKTEVPQYFQSVVEIYGDQNDLYDQEKDELVPSCLKEKENAKNHFSKRESKKSKASSKF